MKNNPQKNKLIILIINEEKPEDQFLLNILKQERKV